MTLLLLHNFHSNFSFMCFILETEYYAVKKKPSKKEERIKLKFLRVNKIKRAFIIISNYFSWAQFSVRRPISANPGLNCNPSFKSIFSDNSLYLFYRFQSSS